MNKILLQLKMLMKEFDNIFIILCPNKISCLNKYMYIEHSIILYNSNDIYKYYEENYLKFNIKYIIIPDALRFYRNIKIKKFKLMCEFAKSNHIDVLLFIPNDIYL